ncbi:hypothetical protein E3N88_07376 [Mikania micrantha]|uniref:Uncharacterized protein n=1 Tax=Mikania micrantha TaxID=192012 RepID=A0A5N6PTR9_9ASTR|nr:hypothetical protein E3N88_07376 [Mikania micrantha]
MEDEDCGVASTAHHPSQQTKSVVTSPHLHLKVSKYRLLVIVTMADNKPSSLFFLTTVSEGDVCTTYGGEEIVYDEELFELLAMALSSETSNTVRGAHELMRSRIDPIQLISQLANLIMDSLAVKFQDDTSEVKK